MRATNAPSAGSSHPACRSPRKRDASGRNTPSPSWMRETHPDHCLPASEPAATRHRFGEASSGQSDVTSVQQAETCRASEISPPITPCGARSSDRCATRAGPAGSWRRSFPARFAATGASAARRVPASCRERRGPLPQIQHVPDLRPLARLGGVVMVGDPHQLGRTARRGSRVFVLAHRVPGSDRDRHDR